MEKIGDSLNALLQNEFRGLTGLYDASYGITLKVKASGYSYFINKVLPLN